MRIASFFSGEGGFDLAGDQVGWETSILCEKDQYCKYLLTKKWPNATFYDDITKADFSIHRGTIDILVGGFPCQPYSAAGKRLGNEDARHLWPEMLRAISEIQPTWVVGENVLGLTNWNDGLVFDEIHKYEEIENYPDANSLILGHWPEESKIVKVDSIFDEFMHINCRFRPIMVDCDDCGGTGSITCHAFEDATECDTCDGNKIVPGNEMELTSKDNIKLFDRQYNIKYIDMIVKTAIYLGVDEFEIINNENPVGGTLFKIGGFTILLMPLQPE